MNNHPPPTAATQANQEILRHLEATLDAEAYTALITDLLAAQGYTVEPGTPERDGTTVVFAASGPLGFQEPRVYVHVWQGREPAGEAAVTSLYAGMRRTKAFHGLLVSRSGFSEEVPDEPQDDRFYIRRWSPEEVVRQLGEHYAELPAPWRVRIPLQRVWALMPPIE